MKNFTYFIFFALLFGACASSYQKDNTSNDYNDADDGPNIALDLTERLKAKAGLRVMGQGARATITLRGVNSISGSGNNEPLFILDQNMIDNYADLHSMVSTSAIKRIEVITNPADLAMYGHRGSNGVIKVITGD